MIALDELHRMPLQEKLLVMEALWDDLSSHDHAVEVPHWHQTLLNEREELVSQGKARFIDWDEAKRQIKDVLQ